MLTLLYPRHIWERSDLTIFFLILCALIRANYLRICLDLTDTCEYHCAHINLFLHYGLAYNIVGRSISIDLSEVCACALVVKHIYRCIV